MTAINSKEYKDRFGVASRRPSVKELRDVSAELIEPAYQLLAYYVKSLCLAYDAQPKEKRTVIGLNEIFNQTELPGKVVEDTGGETASSGGAESFARRLFGGK